jgi:hypothetical protein
MRGSAATFGAVHHGHRSSSRIFVEIRRAQAALVVHERIRRPAAPRLGKVEPVARAERRKALHRHVRPDAQVLEGSPMQHAPPASPPRARAHDYLPNAAEVQKLAIRLT